jgi:hypothetical protein
MVQKKEVRMKGLVIAAIVCIAQPLLGKEPQLSCEKKFGEMNWQGIMLHRYRLRAEHFPPTQTFQLIVKSFDGTQTKTFRYTANEKGHLIYQPSERLQGDIYAICPVKRGERITFLMQAEDGEDCYEADLLAFPLEMKSKRGVKLNLELQGEHGEKFFLTAHGLAPHEPIALSLKMDSKEFDLDAKVSYEGDLYTLIQLPAGVSGGEAKLILKRQKEEIVFPFQCGAPAMKYVGACCFEIK